MRAHVLLVSLFVLACTDDADPSASGSDGGHHPDASDETDAGQGGGECTRVELADFELTLEDDVSTRYGAALTPRIDRTLSVLEILFERYSPEPDVGTFELGGDG